jgi:hypothetical protein
MRTKKLPPVKPIKASHLLAKAPLSPSRLLQQVGKQRRVPAFLKTTSQPTPPEPNTEAIKLAQIRALARQLNLA